MGNWENVDTTDLVYAVRDEVGVLIVPRSKAVELAAIVDAVEGSKTWGELRSRLPEGEWERVTAWYHEDDEEPPADDEPLSPDDIPGWADGDYPDWPAQRALYWMPEDILERFGEEEDSVLNGEFLRIPEENEAGLVAAFRGRGVRIESEPELVLRATRFA